MKKRKGLFIILFAILALAAVVYIFKDKLWTVYKGGLTQKEAVNKYDTLFSKHTEYIADGFDYPVGMPDGKGYYDAQPFTKNRHLGSAGTEAAVATQILATQCMQQPTATLPMLKMQAAVGEI